MYCGLDVHYTPRHIKSYCFEDDDENDDDEELRKINKKTDTKQIYERVCIPAFKAYFRSLLSNIITAIFTDIFV